MNIVFVCQSGYVNQHVTSIPHLHTVTVTCSRKQNMSVCEQKATNAHCSWSHDYQKICVPD